MDIKALPSVWRKDIQPASFRGALFYVEAASKENARRIVTHQFPKKEIPYSEDMGRHAITFSVRGYCIQFMYDGPDTLHQRDYRIARDLLLRALETEGPATLQLPTLPPLIVDCPRYRLTEEEKAGGYCVFDMQFVEHGTPPFNPEVSVRSELIQRATEMRDQAIAMLQSAP
jgi:prophage DNA circulation protein